MRRRAFYEVAAVDLAFSEAQHRAIELTGPAPARSSSGRSSTPSLTEGSREMRLEAYRALREDLLARLTRRFPPRGAPVVG